jgi:hypothetical protein
MTAHKSMSTPERTPATVFFVGNGVMRVAPLLSVDDLTDDGDLPPSWAEYMLDLWDCIDKSSPDFIGLDDFSRLVGPRQAEWFDQLFAKKTQDEHEAPAFRMHLLGKVLHRDKSVLSNPLLKELATQIVHCAASRGEEGLTADVITTNVDCLLEQNIATALDAWRSHDGTPFEEATIESVVDFRSSALWKRTNPSGKSTLLVRIWKVHGCLRDLKLQLQCEAPNVVEAVLDRDASATDFCGYVPTEQLAENLADWHQTALPAERGQRLSGAFSQSEYFDNLEILLRHGRAVGSSTNDLLTEFCELLESRPLIFVGYSIPEVDVDIIYALHRYRQPHAISRWQLTTDDSVTSKERLRQLGIMSSRFEVPAIGYAAAPGKLAAAKRHEWRAITEPHKLPAGEEDWRSAIQRVSSRAWLDPQLDQLRSLSPGQPAASPVSTGLGGRLVVAGLGSIWHGFALLKDPDFPTPRRASAPMISVDQQVPGGSGLVPIVIAAALAGPPAVGKFAFLSNVPSNWSGWAAIQDLCLSAGIETHAWNPDTDDGSQAVGRTSHIVFFDAENGHPGAGRSRQRFIMDVQSLADDRSTPTDGDWSKLQVPAAGFSKDFHQGAEEDFLFTDKLAAPKLIQDWKGPTVYETGTTGLELVDRLRKTGVRPTIWTAGIGSFVRTMAALADPPLTKDILERDAQAILDYLRKDKRLAALFTSNDQRRDTYLGKVIGFSNSAIWNLGGVGFRYGDEQAYSSWLRDHWATLAPDIWSLLGAGTTNEILEKPRTRIGGGLVTTIHEGGLMALWRHRDGNKENIAVKIDTAAVSGVPDGLRVTCTLASDVGHPQSPIVITVNNDSVVLNVPGAKECSFSGTDRIRRNSLAAGDTVRGVMAYGLWAAAYGNAKDHAVDIPRIFLASAALAALKCYAGSFIDFLEMLEKLRGKPAWNALWAIAR